MRNLTVHTFRRFLTYLQNTGGIADELAERYFKEADREAPSDEMRRELRTTLSIYRPALAQKVLRQKGL